MTASAASALFGAACSAVPTSGPGRFNGMATANATVYIVDTVLMPPAS
jgi:hypothetical protein